jgi:hypothetical protein
VTLTRMDYLALRQRFRPETPRLLIIAESPPVGGKYFYNPQGLRTEPLFAALTTQLGTPCASKEEGLRNFQQSGWLLVDATYQPVNVKGYSSSQRNKIIEADYPHLLEDLEGITPDRSVPVILVKANICRLLKSKLTQDRFRVLNGNAIVPFPSTGHQVKFGDQFSTILRSNGFG